MVRKNFTLLLIPEGDLNTPEFENAIKKDVIDSSYYNYNKGLKVQFFRRMFRSFVFKRMDGGTYNYPVGNVCESKLRTCESWKNVSEAKSYLARIPEFLQPSVK